jgi:hypothetical protein
LHIEITIAHSGNLILDNVVLVRKTVGTTTNNNELNESNLFKVNNPFDNEILITANQNLNNAAIVLTNITGKEIQQWNNINTNINETLTLRIANEFNSGLYFMVIKTNKGYYNYKLLKK